jgi:mRNA-degrading endonuclease RelE of RelBE toxin-antitoxin system
MFDILFTPRGERDLKRLPREIQRRIKTKLLDYAACNNPLVFAKPLVNLPPASHRFRIGKYRVSFFIKGNAIFVERVELRSEAYR